MAEVHAITSEREARAPAAPRLRGTSWGWLGSPLVAIAVASTLAVAARVPFVGDPASPDEGGYLVVAAQWHSGGPFSYGSLFVDRPPALLAVFRLASVLGGVEPLRWLGCAFVVLAVAAAGWSGSLVGGRRGAWWSAGVTAALMTSPMLGAHAVDGELLAAPLVLLSCACLLQSLHLPRQDWRPAGWALLAGISGTLAVLVKQNFVDGLVFATVVLAVSALSSQARGRDLVRPAIGWALGVVATLGAVLLWAWLSGPGIGALLYATYGFRSDATHVVMDYSLNAPGQRLRALASATVLSGLLGLALVFVSSYWRWNRLNAAALGAAAMLVSSFAGVMLGLSYWMHYLIQFVPALALATAVLSRREGALRQVARLAVGYVLVASLVPTVTALASSGTSASARTDTVVDDWLAAAARRGDSLVVTYGRANVTYETGLRPAYRYLWSLPLRTLDPQLTQLVREINGPTPPVWVVEWADFNTWGLDQAGDLSAAVDGHYREVQTVCGVHIFLHDAVRRSLPPAPSCPPE